MIDSTGKAATLAHAMAENPSTLAELRKHVPDAVRFYWQTRSKQLQKQREAGGSGPQTLDDVPTVHRLVQGDARDLSFIPDESVHLVVTSPPYWTLKRYNDSEGQLGHIQEYEEFLGELQLVWAEAFRVLVPGGRLVCVVGDVCLSRKENGRHVCVSLYAPICVTFSTIRL